MKIFSQFKSSMPLCWTKFQTSSMAVREIKDTTRGEMISEIPRLGACGGQLRRRRVKNIPEWILSGTGSRENQAWPPVECEVEKKITLLHQLVICLRNISKSQINEVYSFGCIPGKMRNQIALNLLSTSQLVGSGKTRYYNDETKERKIQRFSNSGAG